MRKIVYNAQHGGFSISKKALEHLIALGHEGAIAIKKEYEGLPYSFRSYSLGNHISRSDALLVKTVEFLGEDANGECARLRIEEVGDNVHVQIEEYDGKESVRLIECDCCLPEKK